MKVRNIMQNFKTLSPSRLAMLVGAVVLASGMAWPLMGSAQDVSATIKDPDLHSQHKQKPSAGDPDLASQIAELHAKVARLEAALNRDHKDPAPGTQDTGGLSDAQDKTGADAPNDRVSGKFQNCLQCHQTRPSGPLPTSHLEQAGNSDKGRKQSGKARMGGNKKSMGGNDMDMDEMNGMGAMAGGASPPSAEMKMMDMMMSMMEKMMAGGSMKPAAGNTGMGGGEMGMKMEKMMGMMEKMMGGMGSGSMQPSQTAPAMGRTGGGEMGMKMDKMMGMMEKMMGGMGSGSMQPGQTAPAMGGTGGGEMEMKMDKMMSMMEKMMGGGSMQPGQGTPTAGGMGGTRRL